MYITQALHRAAQTTPDRLASICGERSQTYRATIHRVSRLAGGLRALGIGSGDRVGILALNSDRYLEALYAIPWCGGVLNPVNIRWSAAEIAYSLDDSETHVLFVDDAFAAVVPELLTRSVELRSVIFAGDGPAPDGALSFEDIANSSLAIDDVLRSGDDLAGIFYTGGTTGTPKGVMLSHANLVSAGLGGLASGHFFRHDAVPRALHVAPMFHLADFALFMMTGLRGGTNVIVPNFTPEQTVTAIRDHRVTDLLLVPTMLQMLCDHLDGDDGDSAGVRTLRTIIYGASPISAALLDRTLRVFPDADLVQAYGMTELSALATVLGAADHRDPTRSRSAGRPAPISEIRIIDEDGRTVPAGAFGEILVRGPQRAQGYWRKPEETSDAMGDGWMHTGDAGRVEDGYLYIVDRIKDMIISGGENVYSTEVEDALSQHPAVRSCAVIGIPDTRWGEVVHAVVVLRGNVRATEDDLRAHARSLIAGYKVPRSFEFVSELPLSGAGKVLKRTLRDRGSADKAATTAS